ncbi:nickel-dependent hydrogenase large subunit [Kitasatospora sp. NPDC085879]|uniref:Ni/Fe hydrogenase subunit alpha n=1 Tax=Kitasatospora sp. NPDC085879 TaxID=3154769 RepID=UPI003425AE88
MNGPASRTLHLGALARVEGEAAVRLRLQDGRVTAAELRIYEPPRFFEAFLVGRGHSEPPDLTARICGICPVAYQMTACQAIEAACGVAVDGPIAQLRRLLYYGEWIESQSLHIHLLHAPDFLGCADAVELARGNRRAVERGLRIKQAGNAVMELLGGRPIHPVNVRIGGFYRTVSRDELAPLADRLRRARDDALETVSWVAGFDFPEASFDGEFLALHDPGRYAVDSGAPAVLPAPGGEHRVRGFPVDEFEQHVVEKQVPYSTALQSRLDGGRHLTGSLARYALNGRWLHPTAAEAARAAGLGDPSAGDVCRNPYRSILVRAVEVVHALEEALHIIEGYRPPPRPHVDVPARESAGCAATEAPRGLLYHRYALGPDGTVTHARIVPPTSQNQAAIEEDLRRQVQARLARSPTAVGDEELAALCERAVRNHDPCISCSAHFLDLAVERE